MPKRRTFRSALLALALAACAGSAPAPTAATPAPAAAPTATQAGDPLAGELEAMVRAAPEQRGERRMLAGELVVDWRREAGSDKDAVDVIALLRKELSDKLGAVRGQGVDAGLEVLRAEVYDRRTRALGRRSLALGKAVIDHAIEDAAARAQGQAILDEIKPLAAHIHALHDPARAGVINNDLQEVSLEATFAIARGATSRRLADYQAEKAGAPATR